MANWSLKSQHNPGLLAATYGFAGAVRLLEQAMVSSESESLAPAQMTVGYKCHSERSEESKDAGFAGLYFRFRALSDTPLRSVRNDM